MARKALRFRAPVDLAFSASAHLMYNDGLGEKENLGSYTDVLVPKKLPLNRIQEYLDNAVLEVLDDEYSEGRQLRVTFRFRVPAKTRGEVL